MDRPEDFKKLGIRPNEVELWEESRRMPEGTPNANEVWYFDANFKDESKVIVAFRPIDVRAAISGGQSEAKDGPNSNIMITPPDGRELGDFHFFKEGITATSGGCNLKYGKDYAKGDFKSYDVYFEPTNGIGAELHYEALVEPFRQGTGIVAFGENDEIIHTDLSVPKNRVTGRIFYDGAWHEISGVGYHDHQWMNTNPMAIYHHWLWGRMYTDEFTVYIYDFVASKQYGYKRLPMFGLMNKEGRIIFKTDGNMQIETRLQYNEVMKRDFPKTSCYTFENADGSKAVFEVTWEQEIEKRNTYEASGEKGKAHFDVIGIAPVYMRYFAKGGVTFTDVNGDTTRSSGDMIYEYSYMGKPDPNAGV
ncbi:hypothetical protein [Clostridium fermenticellae]|nr:hypothetical protein [Clostridium fermenticellae]